MKKTSILLSTLILTFLVGCGSKAPAVSASVNTNEPEVSVSGEIAENISEETNTVEETSEVIEDTALKDLCADYFTLGVGINGSTLENQTLNIPEYMELSKKHFNSCTMTNLMKSCYLLDQEGSKANIKNGNPEPAVSFATIDPTLQWCMENGMKMRGHTLVWHTQAPEWFFKVDYQDKGDYVDKETMLVRMESYIRQLMTHVQNEYPGVVYCWDVVNEAVDPDSAAPGSYFMCRTKFDGGVNPWYETIGEDYVEMAFTYARKYAADDVKLFYNDFNTFQTAKRDSIYALCSSLKEKGLIDGIGMQGYWGLDYPSDIALEEAFKKFAELELEIHVTELSVGVDEENEAQFDKQAKKYGRIFLMFKNLDTAGGGPANITNVTLFGLVDHYRDGDTTNSRIFDKNYEPKPAFDKIKRIMEVNY